MIVLVYSTLKGRLFFDKKQHFFAVKHKFNYKIMHNRGIRGTKVVKVAKDL
jgi:hypothetical protein